MNADEITQIQPPQKEGSRMKWPSGTQAAVLIGSGFVLGLGGCAAFLATMQNTYSVVFGALFFAGLILVFAGIVELIVIIVKAALGKD